MFFEFIHIVGCLWLHLYCLTENKSVFNQSIFMASLWHTALIIKVYSLCKCNFRARCTRGSLQFRVLQIGMTLLVSTKLLGVMFVFIFYKYNWRSIDLWSSEHLLKYFVFIFLFLASDLGCPIPWPTLAL